MSAPSGSVDGAAIWSVVTEVDLNKTGADDTTAPPAPAPPTPAPPPTDAPPPDERRKRAVTGGLWSAASQLVPALSTAVLSVAAGRVLGSSSLGAQSLIAYVNSATAAVIVFSLNTALLQVGGRLQGESDEVRAKALTRWAIGAHFGSGLVVLASMAVAALIVGDNHVAWVVIGAVSVLDAVADGLAVRLILTEGWGPVGRLRLVFQLFGPPLGIAFLLAGYGITGIFVGDGIAALGLLIAVFVRYRRRRAVSIVGATGGQAPVGTGDAAAVASHLEEPLTAGRPPFGAEAAAAAELWTFRGGRWGPTVERHRRTDGLRPPVRIWSSYVLFALDALITQVVSRRIEFVVLAILATNSAIGMYSVAFMAVNLISMIPLGIAAAAMPIVAAAAARGELSAATRHLRFALRLGSLVAVPMVGLLAAVGPYAVTVVYGSAYADAARLVPLASLALLVAVISGVCAQFWAGQGRLKVVLVVGSIAAVADVAVAFALIPSMGAAGAVIANLVGQVVLAGGLLRATVRDTGAIGWRARGLLVALLAGVLGAIAARATAMAMSSFLSGVEIPALTGLTVGGLAFVVVALVVSRVLKVFDVEEIEWLEPLLPKRIMPLLAGFGRGRTAS